LGQLEGAREVFESLQQNIKSSRQLHSLEKLIEERRSFALPVDVGI